MAEPIRIDKKINGMDCFLLYTPGLERHMGYFQTSTTEECELCGNNSILWNIGFDDEVFMMCGFCAIHFVNNND